MLSATSINKFKNRFPMGDIIGGACRAQARTIMSGVGELFLDYRGDIVFQGGVAYNRAVAHYLKEITGNNIITPELHGVMGALGSACLARQYHQLRGKLNAGSGLPPMERHLDSINLRAKATRKDFLGARQRAAGLAQPLFPDRGSERARNALPHARDLRRAFRAQPT